MRFLYHTSFVNYTIDNTGRVDYHSQNIYAPTQSKAREHVAGMARCEENLAGWRSKPYTWAVILTLSYLCPRGQREIPPQTDQFKKPIFVPSWLITPSWMFGGQKNQRVQEASFIEVPTAPDWTIGSHQNIFRIPSLR